MFRQRMLRLAKATHLPRRTVRLRLTVLYGALFVVSGAALLGVTYFFVNASTANAFIVHNNNGTTIAGFQIGAPVSLLHQAPGQAAKQLRSSLGRPAKGASGSASGSAVTTGGFGHNERLTPKQLQQQAQELTAVAYASRDRERRQLLIESGIALAIMTVVSILLGWLVAGRVLRPLRTITATTRDISAFNLHERLDLGGPDDELKELGDTIDGLLGRLDAAFRSQRQFVANASHELRTPLTRQRALAQVALSDPDATAASLRAAHERILVSGEQQEQLIDALLTLSRAQSAAVLPRVVDLAAVAGELLAVRRSEAEACGIRVVPSFEPALLSGDPRLVERLVANLIDNAIRHNADGGTVWVRTGRRSGCAWLAVSNDGPVVSPDQIERIYEPFERLSAERTAWGEGFGLGLCIVRAVAAAHDATLRTAARPAGGLSIEVRIPATDVAPSLRMAGADPETGGGGPGPAAESGPALPGGGRPEGDAEETARLVHAAHSDH